MKKNSPVVIYLHGMGRVTTYDTFIVHERLHEVADKFGFAVIAPAGTVHEKHGPHWNCNLNCSNIDDTGFLIALATKVQIERGYDPQRTFICGMSNGAFMSYTMATEAPHIFIAAGCLIGSMSGYDWSK